jgi:hypothetical protein
VRHGRQVAPVSGLREEVAQFVGHAASSEASNLEHFTATRQNCQL